MLVVKPVELLAKQQGISFLQLVGKGPSCTAGVFLLLYDNCCPLLIFTPA
jgi:hypothetical protein